MHPILLKIGFIEVRYYGLMYAIAFLLGLYLFSKEAKRRNMDIKLVENYAFVIMLSGLIGARVYYVLMSLDNYVKNPFEVFAVWHGGMAIHGGILGGIIGAIIFAKVNKISVFQLGDITAAPLILGQAIGRIGNLMNGDAHGVPTITPLKVMLDNSFVKWWNEYISGLHQGAVPLVPWGIIFPKGTPAGDQFPGAATHPVMIYEMILNFIAFLSIWFIFRKKEKLRNCLFFIYLIEYSVIRSIVTVFRADDLMYFGVIRSPHFMSIIIILIAVIMLVYLMKKNNEKVI